MTECQHPEDCAYGDDIREMKATLGRIDVAIRGNGKTGLMTRVALLEQTASEGGKAKDRFWKIAAVCISALALLIAIVA